MHYSSSSRVVYGNPPDYYEMQLWRAVVEPGDLFVDGGANVGVYTLFAAELGARVVAIEPASALVARLLDNVSLNGYAVEIHQRALGAEPGTAVLAFGGDSTCHRLATGGMGAAGAGEEVEVDTLDAILNGRRALGVKLDLEGAEELALAGAGDTLSRGAVGIWQVEWNATSLDVVGHDRAPLADIFLEHGYGLFELRASVLHPVDGRDYAADVFAVAGLESRPHDLGSLNEHLRAWRRV